MSQDAPGGILTLTAQNGDIDLGAGTLVSVGGGKGAAGTLQLFAENGTVDFGGTIDAHAPDGGGSFTLDTRAPSISRRWALLPTRKASPTRSTSARRQAT